MIRRGLGALLILSVLTPASEAAEQQLELLPEQTDVTFRLGASLHTVQGTARLTEGRIVFDLSSGTASGRIVVDATSAETGSKRRDRDMHSKVLESHLHGEIIFTPSSVEGSLDPSAPSSVRLDGVLKIHGQEHPLSMDVTVFEAESDLRAEATFTVPYVSWGMNDPSKLLLRVAKVVDVRVVGVGRLTTVDSAEHPASDPGDSSRASTSADSPPRQPRGTPRRTR